MRTAVRSTTASLIAVASIALLTGCFLGPLADGRSPFDDPSNASRSEIGKAIEPIQSALDDIDELGTTWRAVAKPGSDNCEGACNLRVEVRIEPADVSDLDPLKRTDVMDHGFARYAAPEEVLREALIAAVPIAEQHRVNVYVVPGSSESTTSGTTTADLSDAVIALFGNVETGEGFSVSSGEYSEGEVRAYTRTFTDVLPAMGLD